MVAKNREGGEGGGCEGARAPAAVPSPSLEMLQARLDVALGGQTCLPLGSPRAAPALGFGVARPWERVSDGAWGAGMGEVTANKGGEGEETALD